MGFWGVFELKVVVQQLNFIERNLPQVPLYEPDSRSPIKGYCGFDLKNYSVNLNTKIMNLQAVKWEITVLIRAPLLKNYGRHSLQIPWIGGIIERTR